MDRFRRIDIAGTIQCDVGAIHRKTVGAMRLMRAHPRNAAESVQRSKNLVAFDVMPDDMYELWVERVGRTASVDGSSWNNDLRNMLTTITSHAAWASRVRCALLRTLDVHPTKCISGGARSHSGGVDASWLDDAGGC